MTARKREDLHVGPPVSAIGAQEFARRFDIDLQNLANTAPNLIVDEIQQGPSITRPPRADGFRIAPPF